jgi:Uma2 family endonuclease
MSTNLPRAIVAVTYAEAAQEYLRKLPPEHFMEATAQATQRTITLESFDLVHARRPDIQHFNELLVQYPLAKRRGKKKIGQVVPDNMVVVCEQPIKAEGSFDVPLQPVGPFLVLDCVSRHNKRKDYEQSFAKYEQELKVPYYLTFYPDDQELTLYRHNGEKYVTVLPNEQGRYGIAELELEVALHEGWVRYWFRGELLPLPADLQRDLDEARQQLREAIRRAEEAERARLALEQELARVRAQLGQTGGDAIGPDET